MQNFVLDKRLAESSCLVKDLGNIELRLSNNALVTWLILVPKVAVTEWFELNLEMQLRLNDLINTLSGFLKQQLAVDKVNVATIGNIVPQIHLHVVGRRKNDFCWPNVVWGSPGFKNYDPEVFMQIKNRLLDHLECAA